MANGDDISPNVEDALEELENIFEPEPEQPKGFRGAAEAAEQIFSNAANAFKNAIGGIFGKFGG